MNEMLADIKMKREDVWIGNVIKHRPPENRDPMGDEIAACSPFLEEQLKIINPKIIVTLGRFALNFFIKDAKISEDHGIPLQYKSCIVFPLYHPAAALRATSVMDALREDFKKLPRVLNEEIKPKSTKAEVRTDVDGSQIALF